MGETYLYPIKKAKSYNLNVWMSFPSIYSFGMASLGFLNIYKSIDEIQDIYVEKIFTDTKSTQLKPSDVDIMAFSFSFEMDFLSIFKIMKKYNIPYKSVDRDESHPLIYAGGPVLTSNPEPYSEFFDFIMIGDFENSGKSLFETIRDNKELPRSKLFAIISKIPGIYVPSLTKFDEKENKVTMLDGSPIVVEKATAKLTDCLYTPILSEESYFSNTFIIELQRGCYKKCGFCLASYINLPARSCDYDNIIDAIELGLKHTNKLAFLGALVCSHPRFDDICDYIISKVNNGENIELSISSLRADIVTPKTIEMLVKCGQKNATFAIEAGSERLRKIINKNISEEQINNIITIAKENGLKGLKIYAMIGLPTETQEDIDELLNLAKKLKTNHKGFDLSYSFASFVPKAQTPFQYAQKEDTKSLEKKYEYLKKEFHKLGIKINCSSPKWDYIQALLSRGDRRLADYLVDVSECGGNIGCFKNTYKEYNKQNKLPDADEYALNSQLNKPNLPWDFIKMSADSDNLIKEYNRLLR